MMSCESQNDLKARVGLIQRAGPGHACNKSRRGGGGSCGGNVSMRRVAAKR